MRLVSSTGVIVAAFFLIALSATNAAAQAPAVTFQQSGNRVVIQWSAIPGATTYDVLVAGQFNGETTVPTTFVDVTPPPGTYVIQVRARNGASVGPYSSPITIVVGGNAPTPGCPTPTAPALTASAVGNVVTLNWTLVPNVLGYRIQASRTPGGTELQLDVPASQGSFSQAVPVLGAVYFRVLAGNACGALTPSNEASVMIGAPTPGPAPAPPTGGARTPDPAPGTIIQRATLGYVRDIVARMGAQFRGDLLNSCVEDGGNNVWLFRLVSALRQIDTRWGLNYVRGRAPRMSQDVIAYNPTAGPDEGAQQIYLFDVIPGHCGSNPGAGVDDITDRTWAGGQSGDPACGNRFCAAWTLLPYLAAGGRP
jgi:hypothetical protein